MVENPEHEASEPVDDRNQEVPPDVGQDGPVAQGDTRFSDVSEEIMPGDDFALIDEETGQVVDLSDVEEMEAYASIPRTGSPSATVDSDVEEIAGYTEDEEIIEDFASRQQISGGTDRLLDKMSNYNELSAEISGDDVDAAWHYADQAGEEGVGGSSPTPDQDIVDELGNALGIVYKDDEELNTEDKLNARDESRWELNPESQDEIESMEEDVDDTERGRRDQ